MKRAGYVAALAFSIALLTVFDPSAAGWERTAAKAILVAACLIVPQTLWSIFLLGAEKIDEMHALLARIELRQRGTTDDDIEDELGEEF